MTPDAKEAQPNGWVYGGLFFVTLATLMHEILLTRIFSVTMWYHFAFMAISIAMLGMTLGAIVVYVRPGLFAERAPADSLRRISIAYAVSVVLSFVVYLRIPFLGDATPLGIAYLAASFAIITVPFALSGVAVALTLTSFQKRAASLYAADLVGAALGCLLLVMTLDLTDAASAVLVVAGFGALGGVSFAFATRDAKRRRDALIVAAVVFGAAIGHNLLVRQHTPLLRIVDTAQRTPESYLYLRWNAHSRVSVSGNPFVNTGAAGWGLSEKTGASQVQVRQLGMSIDAWAGTVITAFNGDTAPLAYLKDDVTNIGHYLRPNSDVFVIGVGGGRDILSALVFDQKSVTGVEVNKDVLRATTKVFGDFAGHIELNPKVTLAVDEARSYLTRLDRKFDIVQLSLIDTWAATAAGAFVLTENSLYTTEGWTTFLKHLTPRGLLTVSRWYYPARPGEAIRIASLARSALAEIGVSDPRQHVIMVKAPKASGMPGLFGNGIATILVSRAPFSDSDVETLVEENSRLGFELIVTPKISSEPAIGTILTKGDIGDFYRTFPLDVTPPTDDRPFFFQMLRFRDAMKSLDVNWLDPNKGNLQAVRLLAMLAVVITVLTVATIVTPLLFKRSAAPGAPASRGLSRRSFALLFFFGAIGLGFMFIEVSEMQRLMVLLGKPTYALSVVLFTLLVGSGMGSLAAGRLTSDGGPLRPEVALVALIAILSMVGVVTPMAVDGLAASPTSTRILAASALLLTMGFFMGMPFPIGLRKNRDPALVPWLWGVNGAASVLCSVLATVVAMAFGIGVSFWCGVACYGVALASSFVVPKLERAG
jgi:hypothetical protein